MAGSLFGHVNRPLVALVGLSLLIGVLPVTSAPVRAADGAPSYTAAFDACPEDFIPDADFSDVAKDHPNFGDINCIAYYGITKGTGDGTTYSPDRPVIREHMALFLVRMAELVGIDLPSAGSTPFTDIVDLSEESRGAISQIYKLGITTGTSKTTYTPARNVSRGEMALFLQRLMDEMRTVTDGRDLYGYRPDDVDDNNGNFEVQSSYQDVERLSHSLYDAITELYELGVGSGLPGSPHNYGPSEDMSRAAMAEFMAAILDHSNLRPPGIWAQVSTAQVRDALQVTAMVSFRDNRFLPVDNQVVDWFYTADPGGGLQQDGTCDPAKIAGDGDCVWRERDSAPDEDDQDSTTDRDGNLFATFEVETGDTITFYAWIGRRNGEAFDIDDATYDSATSRLPAGKGDLLVQHDIPEHATVMGGDTLLVDSRDSVEFTVQILDSLGAALTEAGVEVDIEVRSQEITVDATAVSRGSPDPDYRTTGSTSSERLTRTTDQDGVATLVLDGPVRDERLDIVTIGADCCADQVFRIAWSDSDPVVVVAKPAFDPYQYRSGRNDAEVAFQIEYLLYDQYGELADRRTDRYNEMEADVETWRYKGSKDNDGWFRFSIDGKEDLKDQFTLWRVRATVEEAGLDTREEYFLLVQPNISSGSGASQIDYADPVVVWVVKDARRDSELEMLEDAELSRVGLLNWPSGVAFEEVEIYPGEGDTGKFRTFFTMWSYDTESRLQVESEEVGVEEFERAWQNRVDDVDDITIPIYGPVDLIIIK